MEPLYVRVNDRDNVAIIANPEGLPAGTRFGNGLVLVERIPQSHKVALRDLERGEAIVRYGHAIGRAKCDVKAGSWIREDLLELPEPPPLDELPLATEVPAPLPPLGGCTFEGYRNADGSVGTKNLFGITTTVQCVAPTVEHAARRIRAEILSRFPNVDDVVAITHPYGCGVAIDAPGAAIPIRTLGNISLHPNVGGAPVIVSLGCEKMQPERMLPVIETGPHVIRFQDQHGFEETVAAIMRFTEKRLGELNVRRRVSCPASDLVVGVQCGGSDAFSGVTCNPALGYAADLLVRAGATVIFSEVTEVRDAVHLLAPRAVNEEVGRALIREMKWYDEYLLGGAADRSANTTPGNKRGGLANIVEKALGSIAKAGSTALTAVTTHGERVKAKGLVFAATPAGDWMCGTQQLGAGMTMHVFTTGEGSPYGLAMVPVIKVSSRSALAEKWPDLIDVDAGRIATGEASIADVGSEIFQFLLDAASGRKKTWAERWGLYNALMPFNPGPVT